MFDLSKEGRTAIQSVKICFGDLVGKQKDEVWVSIEEPDTSDCMRIKTQPKEVLASAEFIIDYFKGIFPKYLTDHSFCNGEVKASAEEVRDFIFRKLSVADYVTGEYFKEVFLIPQSKTKER